MALLVIGGAEQCDGHHGAGAIGWVGQRSRQLGQAVEIWRGRGSAISNTG